VVDGLAGCQVALGGHGEIGHWRIDIVVVLRGILLVLGGAVLSGFGLVELIH
jgi:hypothetical protein